MGERLSKYKNLDYDNSFSNSVIIKINNNWYDVTDYLDLHPGGAHSLKNWHLRDATANFNRLSSHKFTTNTLAKYKITDENLISKLETFNIIE